MAKTVSIRKSKSGKPAAGPTIDPAALPDQYKMKVVGDCMEPGIKDGSEVLFSSKEPYGPGDIVCIWFAPSAVKQMGVPCALKRLRLAIPPWVKSFPYQDHPKSDVAACVVFESDNPRRTYSVKCRDVAAIHKFMVCQ